MRETDNMNEDTRDRQAPLGADAAAHEEAPPIGIETIVDFDALEESTQFPGLDEEYPLREPSDDPKWALWTVYIWFWLAWFFLMFILAMLFLGALYD